MKKLITTLFTLISLHSPVLVLAKDAKNVSLDDLVLPNEVKDVRQEPGAVFYSKSTKNKVLIPANFWGEITQSGLHFIPEGTTLIKGLSLAGGPTGTANLDEVTLSRSDNGKTETFHFDLEGGGTQDAHMFMLRPGDVVHVPRERFYENRAWYTSLFGVVATVLSTILLYEQVKD